LEECDTTDGETLFICWNNGDEHRCVQTLDASCSQILFDTRLNAGGGRTLATRQENDGIVWSLDGVDLAPGQRIAHKFTIDAFGYVQAGHANKLFSGCPPDGSYACIVHSDHHVFV
jgi:hypothetical protein